MNTNDVIDTTATEVTPETEAVPGIPMASLTPEQQYYLKLRMETISDAEAKRQRRQQRNLKLINK